MKRILTTLILVILLFPAFAFGETMDDLVKRDGIHYKKFSDVPFTGKITGKRQGTFKKGKWNGPYLSYYKNGQLCDKGTYSNGKQRGVWVKYRYRENKLIIANNDE